VLRDPKGTVAALQSQSRMDKMAVVCRRGNDSLLAARALRAEDDSLDIVDLVGGLQAWSKEVNPNFPIY